MVADAVASKKELSFVRCCDGEKIILDQPKNSTNNILCFDHAWQKEFGTTGMTLAQLQNSILEAGNTCTHFGPSISGIHLHNYFLYNHFRERAYYIDNFFPYSWSQEMQKMLFTAVAGILIIHRDHAKHVEGFKKKFSIKNVQGLSLDSWQDVSGVINEARKLPHQLVLFSGGPAGKILAPKIASGTAKIVLDIGQAMHAWSGV